MEFVKSLFLIYPIARHRSRNEIEHLTTNVREICDVTRDAFQDIYCVHLAKNVRG